MNTERENPEFVYLFKLEARVCTDRGESAAADFLAAQIGHRGFKRVRKTGCSVLGQERFEHFDFIPEEGEFWAGGN